ncbi:MAG: acyl carrier protein [Ardenticatenaceae bacterium]|nr:acyl carrier protein [Ardenticatenaceae bacterium]
MSLEISSTLERFIVDELMMGDKNTRVDPDVSLVSSGIVDSLALLRLIAFVEEKFGVTVEDDEVVPDNFETLNIMESFVAAKL